MHIEIILLTKDYTRYVSGQVVTQDQPRLENNANLNNYARYISMVQYVNIYFVAYWKVLLSFEKAYKENKCHDHVIA